MSFEGSGSSRMLLQSEGLHAGPHWSDGNSSETCLQESNSDLPKSDWRYVIRPPHVYVPAPSVTGVFQIVSVQVEQPQYDETVEDGEGVGIFASNDVVGWLVGRVLGEDDG